MWIRNPTPVISSTNTADSGSNNNPKSIRRSPTAMNSHNRCSTARGSSPRSWKNIVSPSRNAIPTLAQPSRCPQRSARRPASSSTAALAAGIATSNQGCPSSPVGSDSSIIDRPSVLQQVGVVDTRRASSPEDQHDDGEPHHHFGRRDHHHEEGHHLAV